MTHIEVMKQALEVMTDNGQLHPDDYKEKKNDAITALRLTIQKEEALSALIADSQAQGAYRGEE